MYLVSNLGISPLLRGQRIKEPSVGYNEVLLPAWGSFAIHWFAKHLLFSWIWWQCHIECRLVHHTLCLYTYFFFLISHWMINSKSFHLIFEFAWALYHTLSLNAFVNFINFSLLSVSETLCISLKNQESSLHHLSSLFLLIVLHHRCFLPTFLQNSVGHHRCHRGLFAQKTGFWLFCWL